jgi:hypothetical protein
MEVDAAKVLAETILSAVALSAKIKPVSAWPTSGIRK